MSQELDIVEPIDGALSFIYSLIHTFTLYQKPTMSHAFMQGIYYNQAMIYILEEFTF